MEISKEYQIIKEKEKEFLKKFLPNNVRSGHSVLFDFEGKIEFVPSVQELQACLQEYLPLIKEAARYNCEAVRGCIGASELALGYLSRAHRAGVHLPDSPWKERLVLLIEKSLAGAKKVHQRPYTLDGYKRIYDIAYLLGKKIDLQF